MERHHTANPTDRPLWKDANLRLIFSVTLCAVMGISLISPVFPKLVEVFHIKPGQATLLITFLTLPGIFLSPVYGILADRWGRKKVLVPLILLFGIAGFACGLARDFNLLLLLRFLQGIGSGGLFTLNNTIIGDLFDRENRFKAIGYNAALISVATAVYPAIGGFIARWHWSLPFYLPGVAIIVAFLILFYLNNPEPKPQQDLFRYLITATTKMFVPPTIYLLSLSFITFVIAMGSMFSFIPFWMAQQYGSGSATIGVVLSLSAISSGITSTQLNRFRSRLSIGKLLALAFLVLTVALWLIPNCKSVWWILIPCIMYGAAQGVNIPSVQALIVSTAPMEYRGAFMAINSSVILSAISAGPAIGGLVYQWIGIAGLFRISAGFALVTGIILLMWGNRLEQNSD